MKDESFVVQTRSVKKIIILIKEISMKQSILMLGLFASFLNPVLAEDANKSCGSCHKPKKERTCAPTPISHGITITRSGCYCLTRDIKGTIVIAHDDVTLDLNCYEIDADGNPYGIVMQNVQDVKVFNGSVSNATDAGILVDPSISIELSNLFMHGNALDAIRVEDSTDISVHDVNFVGDAGGERALNFIACHNLSVARCNASGFLSTIGAVVELGDCHCGSVQDVNVCGNTKTATADVFFFDPGSAFVAVTLSDGIDLDRVQVNNNTFNNTVVLDPNVNFRTASAIQFLFCTACSLTDCDTSNNIDIAGSTANVDTEDFFLCLIICDSCTVTNHKSNNNRCEPEAILYLTGIAVLDSTNVVLDGCQANSNFVAEMLVSSFDATLTSIWVGEYFGIASADHVIRNSQANFNSAANGGSERMGSQQAFLTGILLGGSGVVDHCQANNNTIETTDPLQFATGFSLEASSDAKLLNSSADNNRGGEISTGILLFRINNVVIENCSASSNDGNGLLVGFFGFAPRATQNYVVQNCVFNNNGHATQDAAGIVVLPEHFISNMFIKDCQINGTFSGGGLAAGINIPDASNVVIEGCQIFDTVSSSTLTMDTVAGIDLRNISNALIQNCQIYNTSGPNGAFAYAVSILDSERCVIEGCEANQSNSNNNYGQGFVLRGSTANSKVQDCSAIGNTNDGFADFFEQNSWFGNTAEANNPNYSGVKNTPVVYSKGTGMFSSTPNRWSNIDIQP